MTQYIDKNALVAEIKKRIKTLLENKLNENVKIEYL